MTKADAGIDLCPGSGFDKGLHHINPASGDDGSTVFLEFQNSFRPQDNFKTIFFQGVFCPGILANFPDACHALAFAAQKQGNICPLLLIIRNSISEFLFHEPGINVNFVIQQIDNKFRREQQFKLFFEYRAGDQGGGLHGFLDLLLNNYKKKQAVTRDTVNYQW